MAEGLGEERALPRPEHMWEALTARRHGEVAENVVPTRSFGRSDEEAAGVAAQAEEDPDACM